MMFVKIEDVSGNGEVLVFPSVLKANPDLWKEGAMLGIYGRLSDKDGEIKVLASIAIPLDANDPQKSVDDLKRAVMNYKASAPKNNYRNRAGGNYPRAESFTPQKSIVSKPTVQPESLPTTSNPLKIILVSELSPEETDTLRLKMSGYPGKDPVYFKVNNNGKDQIIKSGFLVTNSDELKKDLQAVFDNKIKIVSV